MLVTDRPESGVLGIKSNRSCHGSHHGLAATVDHDEQVASTFRRRALDFDGFLFPERRYDLGSDTYQIFRASITVLQGRIGGP